MTVKDAVIRVIRGFSGISQISISARMGYKNLHTLASQLSRASGMGMTVSTLCKVCEAMDCQLAILSPLGGEFIIDGDDEGLSLRGGDDDDQ